MIARERGAEREKGGRRRKRANRGREKNGRGIEREREREKNERTVVVRDRGLSGKRAHKRVFL